ncbi:S1 RNA-binding domain-containing protein [Planctomicrobium sp.]|nr:S1 RNA-binding domain-containing protein [Planctomicrobium sp.]MDA7527366.1 S1 RNA-binding domain-containing protein [bacterium]MDB4733143.1 S1 RNA-binding domain-containing protein [Planctomicrobium sp.]
MSSENSAPQDEAQQAEASTQNQTPNPAVEPAAIVESPEPANSAEDSPETPGSGTSGSGIANTPEPEQTSAAEVSAQAEEAIAAAVTANEATATEQTEKPKVQLKPDTAPEDSRPVPSIGGEVGEVAPVSSGPVEMPSATDEEIEAEVAKAITGVGGNEPAAEFSSSEEAKETQIPTKEVVDASIEAAIEEAIAGGGSENADAETVSQSNLDPEDLEPGHKLSGVVQSISGDNVFLDFGMRLSGVTALRQFEQGKIPEPGATIEVLFDQIQEEEGLILTRIPGGKVAVVQSADWDYLSKGQMVECMVKKTNKGGLEVTVGSLRGFIPASQIDSAFVEDMEVFVGKKVTAEITELKPAKKNLVLSRRKVLNARRADAKKQLMEELKPDQVRTGTVKTIKEYGAFIDLGGTDGFLPISQMSWVRIGHPSEIITEGQEVEVKVLSIDQEKGKISLGMRQLTQNPWKVAESKYEKGATVSGRVTKTETFGAFVELEPGIEGLVHISELEHRRVKRVTEVLNAGDVIEVQVLEVNPSKKRISLSMKALKAKPEPVEKPEEPDLPKYERTRKGPLKGGTGSSDGGGLFGNPGDFGK